MMNDKQVDQFINDGIKAIDNEIKAEDDIRDQGEYIARMLAINPVVKVPAMDTVYVLTMRMVKTAEGKQVILLAAEDEIKRQIYGDKYYPALLTAEYNDEFTIEENCQTLVSAFLGKITGNFKIETLEDEGTVKVAREVDMKK